MDLFQTVSDARAAFARGDRKSCAELYRAVLTAGGEKRDEAFQMLGTLAFQSGNHQLALDLTQAALDITTDYAPALVNKAVLLRIFKRHDEARQVAERAVLSAPQSADAWHTLSYLALEAKEWATARDAAERSLAIDPAHVLANANYANILMSDGRLADAYGYATKALSCSPDEAMVHLSLGQILRAAGYPALALGPLKKAYQLRPDYTDAKTAAASALALAGDWDESWALWEARPYDDVRFAHLPRWMGDKVGALLVHAEQGMGDCLQFLRFLPQIRERADKVVLQVPAPLKELVRGIYPDLVLLTPMDAVPLVDAHMPLMSAPFILKTRADDIPLPVCPRVPASIQDQAKALITGAKRPIAGLVWAGNSNHANDRNRSLALDQIQPLIEKGACTFLSLQQGQTGFVTASGLAPFDLPECDPVLFTAALMNEADVVISIDSMPVHLAASLLRPTWLLCPFDPDSRWLYGREDCPWYPTLKLFRQTAPKEWGYVLADVASALAQFARGNTSVLLPTPYYGPVITEHPQKIALPFDEVLQI